ncbi:MAG: hypothetical protein JW730_06895 [Anaerolineales bacterium]|nr:hypothetical protein [Anaerolineales bacterium]
MNAEQAWQSVLGQLQMEMPRASFDTWVRDTKPISYVDGTLTIGVRNAYARDWLESRLASTVSRLLIGIMNASVTVNFVVADSRSQIEGEEPSSVDISNDNPEPRTEEEKDVQELTALDYDSLYEQIVRPRCAVYVLGYFRRWLRWLGPELAWMYIAFFQAVYKAGSRTGKATNRIPGKKIAALAGITERTYWNRVENPNTWKKLKGLVNISDHGPEWDSTSSIPKRLPRRYTVAMTLPLTPVDAASLSKWIAIHAEQCGGPERALRAAAEAPLTELIPLAATETAEPVTVRKLVRDLFGGGELSDELLDSLASAIQNHIMPQNDLIVITQYFLEHVLPHLGAGPGWMVTLLRDMCYVNSETGETRNRVTVKGGYAEVAGWLGMSRPKTIWEWLNEKQPPSHAEAGKYSNAILRVYVNEIGKEGPALDFSGQPRVFDVLIEEIPSVFLEIALTNPGGAIFSIAMARFSESIGATFSIGVARFSYPDGAIFSIAMARFAEAIGATFIVKALKLLKPNPFNSVNTTPLTTSDEPGEKSSPSVEQGAVLPSAWVLDRLLNLNKVHPKTQKAVRGGSAQALVSWLLYALSRDGRGISMPLNYALARLAEDPQCGAGDSYDQLAGLPPAALINLASRAARGIISMSLLAGEKDELAALWVGTVGTEKRSGLTLLRLLIGNKTPHSQVNIRESDRWLDDGTHLIERNVEEI